MIKKILTFLLIVLVVIQFFRPEKNNATGPYIADISAAYPIPNDVGVILKNSCFDCHSNNTNYPWYSNLQPVAWWLNNHIQEGKSELNFNEFGNYKIARQYRKLLEIKEEVEEDEMPLQSYTLIHQNAKLNEQEKLIIMNWADSLRTIIRSTYPADSLVIKRDKK